MNSASTDQIAANLQVSLSTAASGLRRFKDMLLAAKLSEARGAYLQLQAVLIQQRLWARNHSRPELDTHFKAIAEEAAAIHDVLAPYAELMNTLRNVDAIQLPTPSENIPTPPPETPEKSEQKIARAPLEKLILLHLLIHGPTLPSSLSRELRKTKEEIASALKKLRREKWIQSHANRIGIASSLAKKYLNHGL